MISLFYDVCILLIILIGYLDVVYSGIVIE